MQVTRPTTVDTLFGICDKADCAYHLSIAKILFEAAAFTIHFLLLQEEHVVVLNTINKVI